MTTVELSFGGLLSGLLDSVNNTINQSISAAETAGVNLELEAGRQLALAIENAKNSYKDCLDKTVKDVGQAAKQSFDQLNSMVQAFQSRNAEQLGDIVVKAQQLVETLPFASKQSRLMDIRPRYLVIDGRISHLVHFKGTFPWASIKNFEPVFTLNDKKCKLIDNRNDELLFEVGSDAIKNDQLHKYAFQQGELQAPWDDGWVRSHRVESLYRVGLNILPLSPGKITVEYVTHGTERVERTTRSACYHEDGNSYYPQRWHELIETIYPTPDWTIDITKPPVLKAFHEHGNHKQKITDVAPDHISCTIGLFCGSGSNMGIMHFFIDFTEFQVVATEVKRTENVELKWGDSHVLLPNSGEVISKIVFDGYDGSHQEFGGPDLSKPFLKVASEGEGKMKIWAEIPKE